MPREIDDRGKDGRTQGTPAERRDAPSREDVDTSSVRGTLSRHQSGARDSHSQPEQPDGNAPYTDERYTGGGGHTPPLSRAGQSGTGSTGRGDAPLRFGRDGGLQQPEDDGRRRQPRTQRQDAPDDAPADAGAQRQPRLQFSGEETAPARDGKVVSDKAKAACRRADKAASKLDEARENLPTTRRPRVEKSYDNQRGKMKRKLVFEEEVKSQRAHLKGFPITRPINAGKNAAIGYAHKKIHEVEHENVGTEAAHKTEMLAEGGLRSAYRAHKTAPYRRVARLERKVPRLQMKADYKQALASNPKLRSNIFSRMAQKRKIKREYARIAREAKKAGQRAKKAASFTGRITAQIAAFVRRHPTVFLIVGVLALLLIIIMTAVSSCSNMATSTMGGVVATSYVAEDADIDNAELYYTEWETDLQLRVANAESEFPGYDEYRYSVDDIGHGAYELMAYLTARHQAFTYAGIQAELRGIFDEQYNLAFTEEVETRYADPNDENGDGDLEPYEWRILNVTLTARSFTDVVEPRLDAEQLQHYELLMRSKGNRQYSGSPFPFNWIPYVSDGYGYRIHPITGEKNYHKAVDIAVAQDTEILAGHDGTVTSAGDNGGYGLVIVLEGEDGLVTKYAHCSQLLVAQGQAVKMGDVIAKVGSTGDSTGPHLHFEVLKNGQYLNPLYFAITNDDGSSYIPPGSPGGVDIPAYPGAPMGDGSYAALMEEAQKHLGKPYVFGAKGPDTFDCSGFVCWSLSKSGVYQISTNAQGLYNACTPVSRENAQPGDLIFFTGTYNAGRPVTHVGIYIGNGQMIHAGNPVQYASIDTSYWTSHFYAFGR
ncbi:peptidoglycan DD-metalloendopeptidase family protein, partial [Ruminococcaceae bacterium OttesenSCG-928-D13]|nr:peptidoglycan DD-metalloendopeptidase family protein [Ruminococcaceae bacterium OttesenSCG-928-D13]